MDTQPSHPWQVMYPPLQRHDHGWLDVGDGHQVYWEACGDPAGAPALFLHGGPGAGCTESDRRWFDPAHYRIVLMDQRGAGRSRPHRELQANSLQHLIGDIEALRLHLDIERWLIFGGSWGATLALAYAQGQPQRVSALVLRGVFLATAAEREWLYAPAGIARLRPAQWQRLIAKLPLAQSPHPNPDPNLILNPDPKQNLNSDLIDAFFRQLHCGQRTTELETARAWLQWEQDLMEPKASEPQIAELPQVGTSIDDKDKDKDNDEDAVLASAHIGLHYARHAYFLEERQLLAQAARLQDIPGVIVQGRDDRVTPPAAAIALHHAWPGSLLHLVDGAGHASSHPALAKQLIAATDFFRDAHCGPDQNAMETSNARPEARH